MTLKKNLNPQRLVRAFVRTADPRCPLVAVWKLTPDTATADEPPSLLRSAMGRLLRALRAGGISWRAIHIAFALFA